MPPSDAKRPTRQPRTRSTSLVAFMRAVDRCRAKARKLDDAHGADRGVGDAYLDFMRKRIEAADREYAENAKRQTPDRYDRP